MTYTTAARQQFLRDNLSRINVEWLTYHEIALAIKREFGLQKLVSTATIARDLHALGWEAPVFNTCHDTSHDEASS